MTPMASKAPTAPATSGTALTFSFNSINSQRGGAAQQQQQQQQLKARQTQETLQAIARIAQQQRSQPAPTPMMPTAPTNGGAGAHTLPSGFLNGGNQHVDAQAEVMRLAATVDSLNTKLGSQAERLQRTEASLVRANRAMTSERATANARLLRMQNEVKELKSRETSLRENALAQARRELQKTDAAFNESVKRAEEFDAKLTTLQDTIQALTAEREALSKQITGLTVELKQSTARAAGAEARLAEVPDPSVAEAKVSATLATLREETMQRKELAARLQDTEAKHDAVLLQLDKVKAEATTARASADAAAAAARQEAESHELARQKMQEEVTQLLAQKEELKVQLEAVASRASQAATAALESDVVVETADPTPLVAINEVDVAAAPVQESAAPIGEAAKPSLVDVVPDVDVTADTAAAAAGVLGEEDDVEFGTDVSVDVETSEIPDFLQLTTEELKGQLEEVELGLEALFNELDNETTVKLYTETGKLAKRRQALDAELQTRCPPPTPVPPAPPVPPVLATPLSVPVAGSEAFGCFYGEVPGTDGHHEDLESEYEDDEEEGAEDPESTDACSRSTFVFQSEPSDLHAHLPFHAPAQHSVKARLDACFRASQYETLLVRRPIHSSQFALGMQQVDVDAVDTDAATGNVPPDVAALIGAVSTDISDAVQRTRIAILRNLGVPDEEIQEELAMYS